VRALTSAQAIAYANSYELGHIPNAANQYKAVKRAIGCPVKINVHGISNS
jgi:hypothetical protein